MQTKQIPANACRFIADVEVGTNGEGAKTAPIKLVARSGGAVDHWYWGKLVHDMAGMTVSKPRIPLDYCHDDESVIGYANNFDTSSGDLVLSGALVPYAKDPEDKATEVIYKSQNGVPYEASIFFDGPLALEEVGEGAIAQANGRTWMGPITIVRQWTLRGCAVCPYGQDSQTSSEMALSGQSKQITATIQGAKKMSAETTAVVEETTVEATEELNTSAEATAEVAEAVETPAVEESEEPAVPVPVEAAAMSDGEKFLKTFGDKGGVWFAQGKTFEQAQQMHFSDIVAERDQLKKDNDELKQKLSVTRGEAEPLSASIEKPAATKAAEKAAAYQGKLSEPLARFAASLTKE